VRTTRHTLYCSSGSENYLVRTGIDGSEFSALCASNDKGVGRYSLYCSSGSENYFVRIVIDGSKFSGSSPRMIRVANAVPVTVRAGARTPPKKAGQATTSVLISEADSSRWVHLERQSCYCSNAVRTTTWVPVSTPESSRAIALER